MHSLIQSEIQKLAALLSEIQTNTPLLQSAEEIAKRCIASLQAGKKILFAGNGGSAADAQHLAAELVSRLRYNRPGLAAMALTTDTSALTAIGNDYAFENIFSRQVESLAQEGDVFIGITTSGKSPNILKAMQAAKNKGAITIALTGSNTAELAPLSDAILSVPSRETPKIQECHIMFGHIICAIIEDVLFGEQYDPARQKMEHVA